MKQALVTKSAIARRTQHAGQVTLTISSPHGMRDKARRAYVRIAGFLADLRENCGAVGSPGTMVSNPQRGTGYSSKVGNCGRRSASTRLGTNPRLNIVGAIGLNVTPTAGFRMNGAAAPPAAGEQPMGPTVPAASSRVGCRAVAATADVAPCLLCRARRGGPCGCRRCRGASVRPLRRTQARGISRGQRNPMFQVGLRPEEAHDLLGTEHHRQLAWFARIGDPPR